MARPEDIEALLDQVESGDELVAVEASKLLADARGEYVIAELSRILRSAREAHSRRAAAHALAWHKERGAVLTLLECAADVRQQDDVRGQAVEGLAMHLGEDPVGSEMRKQAEDLMILLLQSPSPALRFWSCFGLGTLRCERAVPHLHKLSQDDDEVCPGWWYVREEAADALDWIAGKPGRERIPIPLRKAGTTEPDAPPNGGPSAPVAE